MISETDISKKSACRAVCISRSSYYNQKDKGHNDPDIKIKGGIQSIALEFPRYGYRRITKELQRRGTLVNHKKVLRIMREDNLLCIRKRLFIRTTDSDHGLPIYPNLIRDYEITGLNQVWVSDITYILLAHEHIYLAVIIERFSRKCIGWDLGRSIDTRLALNALEMAVSARQSLGINGVIHHSDQGVQYASHDYVNRLKKLNIKISMSRRGNPYDNAFAESFMKTLKAEEVYLKDYENLEEAHKNIKEFIERVYNKKRLHSSIGYVPPDEFETKIIKTCLT